ncbi:MAG TPA: hypothetical protein VFO85_02120 [Vicinamibacteria bacterium]|nr:hypothetical protein [Vicinamibacteria bacterium]
MDWMKQLGSVLDRYTGDPRPDAVPDTVEDDFDEFARTAPPEALSDGLAAAFRSDQTPEFAQMAGQMFGRAPATQRAGILNALIQVAGPLVLQQVLARRQSGTGGGGGVLGDILGRLGGGQRQISPEDAEQVDPQAVEEIAREAEKKDPSIIDRLSRVYAEQPQLLKTLGGMALAIALGRMAQKHGTLR